MFGTNGNGGLGKGDVPQSSPPDTGSLWGDMFGVSSLFKVISDPSLMAHAHQMMASVIEGANANRRIEAKLDRLLKAIGHEISDINARFPSAFHPGLTHPALPQPDGADGAGGHSAATGASDDGSALAPDDARKSRSPVRSGDASAFAAEPE
jgi:hypothetical protein